MSVSVCTKTNCRHTTHLCVFFASTRTFDTLRNHPSFYLFNHRGRVLFRPPEQESSTPSPQALPSNPLRLRKLENFHWDWPSEGCLACFDFFSCIYLLAPPLDREIIFPSSCICEYAVQTCISFMWLLFLSMDCANSFSSWYVCKYLLLLGSLKSVGYTRSPSVGSRKEGFVLLLQSCTMLVCNILA